MTIGQPAAASTRSDPSGSEAAPRRLVRRVLITGAGGYIGSNLVARFLQEPEVLEIRAGVRTADAAELTRRRFPNDPRLTTAVAELPDEVWDLEGIDTIVHAAAWISLRHNLAAEDTYRRVNIEGSKAILDRARASGVERLVPLSTQAVYGTRHAPPWHEQMPMDPETPYATSKAEAERLFFDQPGTRMPTVVLRVAKVYGAGIGIRWQDLPHKFVALTARMQPVTINGGGKEVVDLLHVRDLAEAVVRACSRRIPDRGSVLNIGGGSTRSVLDLAELCNDIARGRDLIPAPFRYGPSTTSGRVRKWGMRIDSARAVLGWTPAVRLRDGVRELFDAFLRERDDAALTAPYSKGSDRG